MMYCVFPPLHAPEMHDDLGLSKSQGNCLLLGSILLSLNLGLGAERAEDELVAGSLGSSMGLSC